MNCMTLGHRIMIPVEGTSFKSSSAEMRRLGTYPSVLPYAVLFGYFELVRQSPNLQAWFSQQFPEAASDPFLGGVIYRDREEACAQSTIKSQEFYQAFLHFAGDYFQRLQIDVTTSDHMAIAQSVASSLGLGVCIDNGSGTEYQISSGESGLVTLGVIQETCFLLYQHYTTESFCRLPCGHLQRKYALMREFSAAAGLKSVSLENPALGSILLCSACNLYYNPLTHCSFALQVIESLNSPTSLQLVSQLSADVWENTYVCCVCYRTISREMPLSYCVCSNTICESCFVVNFFTAQWDKCPKCKENLTYAASEVNFFTKEPLLQPLIPTSNYGLQPVTSKYCSKCFNLQDLTYFQSTENVNSWQCYTCISQSTQEYQTKSGESDFSGAVQKLQLSEDECSDDDQRVAAPVPFLEASALQSRVSDDKCSSYEQAEAGGVTLVEAPALEDTQGRTNSNKCSMCPRKVEEEILTKLETHAKCKVCSHCVLAFSNMKKCPNCDFAYSEEEKTAIRKLIAEIRTQPFARCSFCSKSITLPVHRCADAKSICVPCFLYQSIDTVLGLDVKCKLCGEEAEESFKAAVLDIHFSCSTCSGDITIHNLGHVCKDNRLFCQHCIGSLQPQEVHCDTCKKPFLNRHC